MAECWGYGEFGEIIPELLSEGANPEETVQEMAGDDIYAQMPPEERALFYGDAATYAHQKQLERVFSGQVGGDDTLGAIREAVMTGTPITLCPPGYENLCHFFAPTLTHLGNNAWRVGGKDTGPVRILFGPPDAVYRQARELYVAWFEAGEQALAI